MSLPIDFLRPVRYNIQNGKKENIMKLLIVRHGDPDYKNDTLTERGKAEAELLSERLCDENIKAAYVSTMGRAALTADYTLKKIGLEPTPCDWLREFPAKVNRPDVPNKKTIVWDWLPADWTGFEDFYSKYKWLDHPTMAESDAEEKYRYVTENFDSVLTDRGYVREGNLYRAAEPNEDTIAFFCHFGTECVLLSHLLGISPMLLWHGFCAAPTSVTTVYTEERREGLAYFRVSSFGDVSHLFKGGMTPSFSGRFCETYYNTEQRHD